MECGEPNPNVAEVMETEAITKKAPSMPNHGEHLNDHESLESLESKAKQILYKHLSFLLTGGWLPNLKLRNLDVKFSLKRT